MNLTVNGRPAIVDGEDALSVTALLEELKVKDAQYVSVELNGSILDRQVFGGTFVRDGDTVEFLYFMGGGVRPGGRE